MPNAMPNAIVKKVHHPANTYPTSRRLTHVHLPHCRRAVRGDAQRHAQRQSDDANHQASQGVTLEVGQGVACGHMKIGDEGASGTTAMPRCGGRVRVWPWAHGEA